MEESPQNDNQCLAKSTFKDTCILISPNNDDVIIPISATFNKAVLHIGIGNGCGIFIEKFGMKTDKELKTSVKYATRRFSDARHQRKNKGKDLKASKMEDIKIVDGSVEKFTRDIQRMKEIDCQLAKLVEHLLVQAPTEFKIATDTISDTKPLKEKKSLNIENDITATDESIQSTIDTFLTSEIKSVVRRIPMHEKEIAEIATPTLIELNMNTHLYRLNETHLKEKRTTSFESIDKTYQNEMLEIANDTESGVCKPNCIYPSTETGFPLTADMHVYLDEVFVISKKGSQMFDEYVTTNIEKRRKDKELEGVSESCPTSAVVNIEKEYIKADSNLFGDVLDKDEIGPISSDTIVDKTADNDIDTLDRIGPDTFGDFLDRESYNSVSKDIGAVDDMPNSDTQDDTLIALEPNDEIVDIKESDDNIVDFEPIALEDDQDEVDITEARNGIDDTYITYNDIFDDDGNLFGIMDIYIKSDLHFDLHNIPASAELFHKKKDFGYKFFSFLTFFK
ncbi:uncharacterized protein LOC132718070 [Ruditapes philippinarum]|uniref:uncharacterized protein LOC132718070 n=1 Tax=Ruditapes philippinarum TaxID=129788 RepID=UPI00295BA45C|nr:uncharacterized protein LOC132718070 [Ruditapes philippinarum]